MIKLTLVSDFGTQGLETPILINPRLIIFVRPSYSNSEPGTSCVIFNVGDSQPHTFYVTENLDAILEAVFDSQLGGLLGETYEEGENGDDAWWHRG